MAPQGPIVAYPKIVEPCVKGQGLALSGSAKDSKTCLWYERIGILNANQDTYIRKYRTGMLDRSESIWLT